MINDLTSFFEGKKEKVLNFLAHLKLATPRFWLIAFPRRAICFTIGFFKTLGFKYQQRPFLVYKWT